ncbi:hypothetical protein BDW72DRAFT_188261 [Aspergillus terricola var. indicus]
MPQSTNSKSRRSSAAPVKTACLECRASKTRCDGHHPCDSCRRRGKDCSYRASRRGGARKGARYEMLKVNSCRIEDESRSVPELGDSDSINQLLLGQRCDHDAAGLDDTTTLTVLGLPVTPVDSESQNPNHSPSLVSVADELSLNSAWPDMTGTNGPAGSSHQSPYLTLRAYKSEAEILNAYYLYIHPHFPILPPPLRLVHEANFLTLRVHADQPTSSIKELLPCWPLSPLSLALSAILVLIPPPEDFSPDSMSIRRAFSDMFAKFAEESAYLELENMTPTFLPGISRQPVRTDTRAPLHTNVQLQLEAVLALVTLSAFEYCRRGNIGKMRIRINHAVTAALDMSLHNLGTGGMDASEAQRRAWWMTMYMMYLSSILSHSQPIITMDDPRISIPYPKVHVTPEPWPLMLNALKGLFMVTDKMKPIEAGSEVPLSPPTIDDWESLDSYVNSVIVALDRPFVDDNHQRAETAVAKGTWAIARILIHTAQIRLHRVKALLNAPIFLQQYCGLASINGNSAGFHRSIVRTTDWASHLPFNEEESSVKCLRSALTVARAFVRFPVPMLVPPAPDPLREMAAQGPAAGGNGGVLTSFHAGGPALLPYFACCAMQSCYALLMVLYKLRAASATDRLAVCYHLLHHPSPGTEIQDSERLEEEIRHGVQSLRSSLRSSLFEAINGMGNEIDSAQKAAFLY